MSTSTVAPGIEAVAAALNRARSQSGESLDQLAARNPLLLVFLRHAGCTFCREALSDIAASRAELERQGIRIVLVHMGDAEALDKLLVEQGLAGVDRIADPDRHLYRAFGLKRGKPTQLFGPKVLWRAIAEGALARHGIGKPSADPSQLPGVFFIDKSMVRRRFRHRTAADRPDYLRFCTDPSTASATGVTAVAEV